jgi:hypothetical protein
VGYRRIHALLVNDGWPVNLRAPPPDGSSARTGAGHPSKAIARFRRARGQSLHNGQ